MTALLSLQNVTCRSETELLLERATLAVTTTTRLGLVGANGCGKSTLLRVLARQEEPDDGTLVARRGLKIELVSQLIPEEWSRRTLYELVAENTAGFTEQDSTGFLVETWLHRLEIPKELWTRRVEELSGGWCNRLMLARALAAEPDLLLLDEPTNHMDGYSIHLFEAFLLEQVDVPFVIVSHDRALLDRCTNETAFVRDRKVTCLPGGYSEARVAMAREEAAQAHRRAAEEKEIARLEAAAKQLAHWGRVYENEKASRRARSMERRIEVMHDTLTPRVQLKTAELHIAGREVASKLVVHARDMVVEPVAGVKLFKIDELYVKPGERLAVLGANGSGKTTMLEALVRDFRQGTAAGGFRFSPQTTLGYYDQLLVAQMSPASLYAFLREAFPTLTDATLRQELIKAGFPYARLGHRVNQLSGGERARLQLLYLKLLKPSLLVLDEPTNHIDVEGCEALEAQLIDAGVACIFVSHDRRFVANVATRVVRIEGGRLREA